MTLKAHISKDFNRMTDPADQVALGLTVAAMLATGIAQFPNLPVAPGQLTTYSNNLNAAFLAYKQNGSSHKGTFLEALSIWKQAFTQTAEYCDLIADGSLAIINMTGFRPTKTETTPAELPSAPVTDVNISTEKGAMSADAKAVRGAKGYVFSVVSEGFTVEVNGNQVTLRIGNEVASFIIGTGREVKFQGLPCKTDVVASAAAFNSAGLGSFSDAVNVTIP